MNQTIATTTKKITKRENFTTLLGLAEVQSRPELVEFINHEIGLLDNKKSAKKPNAKQVENDRLAEAIVETLNEYPDRVFTVSELMKQVPALAAIPDISTQRVSPIMSKLVEAERVEKIVDKRRSYFKAM